MAVAGETPRIKKIVVRDLTDETHGNATGIGCADYTTQSVVDKMDYNAMRVNCVTSGRTGVGMIPIYFSTEQEAVDAALQTCGLTVPEQARVVWIRNTLDLQRIACSTAMVDELMSSETVKVISNAKTMTFSTDGRLTGPGPIGAEGNGF